MGVNTALIQAALLSRARVYTVVPAKMEARIDMIKGNFKLQVLPVQGIDKIATALYVLFLFTEQHASPSFESVFFLKLFSPSQTALRLLLLQEMWKTSQLPESHQ